MEVDRTKTLTAILNNLSLTEIFHDLIICQVYNDLIYNTEGVIHQGTFTLAEEAKLGTYNIDVKGKSFSSCSFSVEEYVLPKFGVEIEGK